MFSTQKSLVQSGVSFSATVFNIAMDHAEKVAALYLNSGRSVLETSNKQFRSLFDVKNHNDLIQLSQNSLSSSLDQSISVGQKVFAINAEVKDKLTKEIETQVSTSQKQVKTIVDESLSKAPKGSEKVISAMKTGIATLEGIADQSTKIAKSASAQAEISITKATDLAIAAMKTTKKK